jgi:hypothetical protein
MEDDVKQRAFLNTVCDEHEKILILVVVDI